MSEFTLDADMPDELRLLMEKRNGERRAATTQPPAGTEPTSSEPPAGLENHQAIERRSGHDRRKSERE